MRVWLNVKSLCDCVSVWVFIVLWVVFELRTICARSANSFCVRLPLFCGKWKFTRINVNRNIHITYIFIYTYKCGIQFYAQWIQLIFLAVERVFCRRTIKMLLADHKSILSNSFIIQIENFFFFLKYFTEPLIANSKIQNYFILEIFFRIPRVSGIFLLL